MDRVDPEARIEAAPSMKAFSIASATAADLADVVRLFSQYQAHIGVDLSYQDFAAELAGLPGKYAPPRGRLLVARAADGSAIGCVAMRPLDGDACEMKRLFVTNGGRGLGLGRALAQAVIADARQCGYAEVKLDTLPTMREAIALYRTLGFEPVEPYYAGAPHGTLFMSCRLAGA